MRKIGQMQLKDATAEMSRGMSAVAQALGARRDALPEYNHLTNSHHQFLECAGNTNTTASWISDATYRIETRGTSETAAI